MKKPMKKLKKITKKAGETIAAAVKPFAFAGIMGKK